MIYYKEIEELVSNSTITNMYIKGINISDWGDQSDFVEDQKRQIDDFIYSSKESLIRQQAHDFMEEAKALSRNLFQTIAQNQIQYNQALKKIYYDIKTGNIPGVFVIGDHNTINQNQ